jgi:glycosyltransferase involved in cell wall biosynthesis
LVISTATSGARALIKNGENGLLFDLEDRSGFMMLMERSITNPAFARQLGHAGQSKARLLYDSSALAGRVRELYEELISPRA